MDSTNHSIGMHRWIVVRLWNSYVYSEPFNVQRWIRNLTVSTASRIRQMSPGGLCPLLFPARSPMRNILALKQFCGSTVPTYYVCRSHVKIVMLKAWLSHSNRDSDMEMLTMKRDNFWKRDNQAWQSWKHDISRFIFAIDNSSSPSFSMMLKDSVRYCGWWMCGEWCEQCASGAAIHRDAQSHIVQGKDARSLFLSFCSVAI